MIARLHGAIVETGADYLVIDTGGVGYKVRVPDTTATSLKGKTETTLHTEMIVRQDAILLYGFATQAELKVFRLLISVSRVGPQLATSILSRLRADQVAGAVIAGDSRLLATVPGVGKTGAERIVLELKKKIPLLSVESGEGSVQGTSCENDAILGLMALGYTQAEASGAVSAVYSANHEDTAAGIIRQALRFLKEKSESHE